MSDRSGRAVDDEHKDAFAIFFWHDEVERHLVGAVEREAGGRVHLEHLRQEVSPHWDRHRQMQRRVAILFVRKSTRGRMVYNETMHGANDLATSAAT